MTKSKPKSNRNASMSSASSNISGTVVASPPRTRRGESTATGSASMATHEEYHSMPEEESSSQSQSESQSQPQGLVPDIPTNVAHPAFADIGKKLKACNDTLGQLQLLGVSHVAVLPELVLVGDQSAGKSSLMSALARLDLPTSNGICTRCPFHIRMISSRDAHWSCTVSLQQEYDYQPNLNRPIRQSDVTKKNQFPPWVQKPMIETKVFKTKYQQDSTSIDEILKWAQIAILNPTQNHEQFVPGEGMYAKETDLETAKRNTEARFSPNIVSLEMKGPDFPDLSFYDLPGVFAISELKGDDYLVDVVENLTRKYVAREKAIIMLALPMDLDIDISRTLKIIRDSNAEDRTIGVLTKADRPSFDIPNTVAYWLAVLQGKKQTVGHGFFATSLPPGKGLDALAAWEESFFRAGVWPLAFDEFVDRCGVDALRVYITKQLGDAFVRSLPEIKEKFLIRLAEIEAELKMLPELPQNVEHEVRMSLRDFYTSVKYAVGSQDFEQECKQLNEEFYRCLVQMKPKCVMATERSKPKMVIELSDDEADEPVTSSRKRSGTPSGSVAGSAPKRPRHNALMATPIKAERERYAASPGFHSPAIPKMMPLLVDPAGPFSGVPRIGIRLKLLEIQQEIRHKTRGGFGDVVPLEVHETLCLKAVAKWKEPLEKYIENSIGMLMSTVTEALQGTLGSFSKRLIFKESQDHLMAVLHRESAVQSKRLTDLYENETYKAVTMNEDGLNNFKAKEKDLLESYRLFSRVKAAGLIDDERLFESGLSPEEEKRFAARLPEDDFKREIEVAAKVRAYYLTAATRFVDGVSMDINSRLFRSFREGGLLEDFLEENLGLSPYPTRNTYERLMEEEETTAQRREQLKREREKLSTAKMSIDELEGSFVPGSNNGHYNTQRAVISSDSYEPCGKMEEI